METETKTKPKKREWIKNAAIIFLAVLLVLTFFSNTILNSSLPEVATKEIAGGTITARIRVTGTVSANQNYEVSVDESRKVRTVMVKQGQEVQAGDVLFVLSDGESEELEAAQDSLRELQRSYQEKLISASDKDYARENREIQLARNALADAERERDNLTFDETPLQNARQGLEQQRAFVDAAQAMVESAKQEVEQAKAVVEAAKRNTEVRDTDVENAELRVSAAQAEVNRLNRELSSAQNGRDRSRDASGERGKPDSPLYATRDEARKTYDTTVEALEEARNNLEAARLSYGPDWDALEREAVEQIYRDRHRNEDITDWEPLDDEAYRSLLREYAELLPYYMEDIAKQKEVTDAWRVAYEKITDAEEDVETARRLRDAAKTALDSAERAIRDAYNEGTYQPAESYDGHSHSWWEQECLRLERLVRSAEERLEDAQNDLTRAKQFADQRSTDASAELNRAQDALTAAQERLSERQERLNEAKQKQTEAETSVREEEAKKDAFADKQKAAADAVKAAEQKLGDLLVELQAQQQTDDRQSRLEAVELQNLAEQVGRAQARVSELREAAAEKEVTSPVAGVIQRVDITAGQTTTPKTAMAVIELPDMGYVLNAPVSLEQARRVHVGDTATVSNLYWGTQIDAVLTAIKPDPRDPQNQRQLTFELSGDVSPGANLTLSVGQRSAEYDFVVPNSALRSDSNGDFILVVETKASPLGNRYTATRVNVTKLANDDSSTAISGALELGDFVITTSTAPLKNGDRVRLADNQNGS